MSSRLLLVAVGTVILAGCNTANKNIGMEDPSLGEAVRYNAAIQTVNPDPVYPAGSAQPGDSGVKATAAVKRYRTDAVKQVESMGTTGGGGSSSGPR
jgi:predicted small secreted protein